MKHKPRPQPIPLAVPLGLSVGTTLLVVACAAGQPDSPPQGDAQAAPETSPPEVAAATPMPQPQAAADPDGLLQLESATFVEDDKTYTISQLIPRDGILPIYNPTFVTASEATYIDEELVIGVEIDGEAKAYPITLLNQREMVNDQLGGIPILVTW